MPRVHFGHCIGCDQPIRPPYLSFAVSLNSGPDGNSITEWEAVDVCTPCAGKLTAEDVHRLVTMEDEEASDEIGQLESPEGRVDRRRGYASSSAPSQQSAANG